MKTQVEIHEIQDPDGIQRVRFTIAFQDAIQNESLSNQLVYFQEQYLEAIQESKKVLNQIKKSRKNAGDPILKWQLADILVNFLNKVESKEFINHLSILDVEHMIQEIQPKLTILTHFGLGMIKSKPDELARTISQKTGLSVIAASDEMSLSLETLSTETH